MIGRRRTGGEKGGEKGGSKRKWQEDGGDDSEEETAVAPTNEELEAWKQKEDEAEKRGDVEDEVTKRLREPKEQSQLYDPSAPPPPAGQPPSEPSGAQPHLRYQPPQVYAHGLRMGEGSDSGRSFDEVRVIRDLLCEEVDNFVLFNKIDTPATRDLKMEPVPVQLAVLDRGPLMSCKNPSGTLVTRIKEAKRHGPQGPLRTGSGGGWVPIGTPIGQVVAAPPPPNMPHSTQLDGPAAVERFCIENRLDQGASLSLRAESQDVQNKVVQMGPLVNANNTSAALMGRIRTARTAVQNPGAVASMGGGGGPPMGGGGGPPMGARAPPPPPPPPPGGMAALPGPGPSYDMAAEAAKAIERLAGGNAGAAPQAPPMAAPNGSSWDMGAAKLGDGAQVGDSRLNEEAMRAIAALNDL